MFSEKCFRAGIYAVITRHHCGRGLDASGYIVGPTAS